MKTKSIVFMVFIIVAAAQLMVPAKMIRDQENILQNGKAFKFKVAPIDPTNPFRGKYITLYFTENQFKVTGDTVWNYNEPIFVELATNESGFAMIKSVSKTRPQNRDFVEAKARYYYSPDSTITIDFPFREYYMEESKAPEAEIQYNESARDTTQIAYALVKVLQGESALADVLINNESIKDIVKKR